MNNIRKQVTNMETSEQIDKLASRHIAKCLDFLGDTLAPAQVFSIKRSFRFFADDIKQQVINKETSNGSSETSQ